MTASHSGVPKFSWQSFPFFLFGTATFEPVQQQNSPKSGVGHVPSNVCLLKFEHACRGNLTLHDVCALFDAFGWAIVVAIVVGAKMKGEIKMGELKQTNALNNVEINTKECPKIP